MRITLLILALSLMTPGAQAQRDYLLQPPPDATTKEDTFIAATKLQTNSFSRGAYLFQKGNYAGAEKYLRQAFNIQPDETAARYLFYALLYQGYDLEAARFKQEYPQYTFILPPPRKGPESVYMEFGPRVSVPPDTAGNIYYASVGGFIRVSSEARLWQSATYLRQDFNLGRFTQGEYFAALYTSLPHQWMLKPSVHYIYNRFAGIYNTNRNVNYSDTVGGTIYNTTAEQVIRYNNPGTAHYLHLSLPVSKRLNTLSLEILPSVQLIRSKYRVDYTYTASGLTDSIQDNEIKGTRPYSASGEGRYDTSETSFIGQIGAGAAWNVSIAGRPLLLRAAAFYLFNNMGENTLAFNAGLTYHLRKNFRIYANWMRKGKLPFSLDTEGQYFNHYHTIRNRASMSIQLFPMRQFSPLFTYQFEQQERFLDKTILNYHSIYLTIKYSL